MFALPLDVVVMPMKFVRILLDSKLNWGYETEWGFATPGVVRRLLCALWHYARHSRLFCSMWAQAAWLLCCLPADESCQTISSTLIKSLRVNRFVFSPIMEPMENAA